MQTVQQIAAGIVAREGGFVNDPNDPGGATNYGVTIATMRALGLDLDKDGDVDVADVRRMTPDLATGIFIRHYFDGPRIGLLPACIQASVFDMQVNAGSNAVRILQRLLRRMSFDVAVDGAIGPKTAQAAHKAAEGREKAFADAYGIARRNYYFRLADGNPKLRKFAMTRAGGKGGWIRRAEEFISPEYHLTEAEFRERIASWAG